MRDISNSDDVLDSLDIIKRIEELEQERDDLQAAQNAAIEALQDLQRKADATEQELADADDAMEVAKNRRANFDEDSGDELKALCALRDDADGSPDWQYGETLIRESYFKAYAQELAEDCCPVPRNSEAGKILESWPYRCIDWEQATRELKMDYTTVDFDGVDYLIRS